LKSSDLPTIHTNEVLVKNHFISVDPYHRGLIRSMTIGQSIQAGQVGEVIESQSKKYGVGDMLLYYGNQSTHNVIKVKEDEESSVLFHAVKVPALPANVSSSVLLGALGMPGKHYRILLSYNYSLMCKHSVLSTTMLSLDAKSIK
jgi:NADPH-dependent curcumin reductase CurA